jgi:hypothetical protein
MRSMIANPHKHQIPPLRYAPVGMTNFVSTSDGLRFDMELLRRGETKGVVVFVEFEA